MMNDDELSRRDTLSAAMNQDTKDARKFPRYPVELPCLFSGDEGPDWSGTAINLSHGGCAIRSTAPVKPGDYLRLLLFLSREEGPIEVGLAPVRWATTDQFGVEFIMLAPRDVKRLQELVALSELETARSRKSPTQP